MRAFWTHFLCLALAGPLAAESAAAQVAGDDGARSVSPRSAYLGYKVERGDTVYFDSIDPVWVYPKGYKGSRAEMRKYYRLVYNFNKVYPYAKFAKELTHQVDRHIAENSLRRRKKEKYITQMQDHLFAAFEKPLRGMSISQGRLLIRLVDREIGRSSYLIIKDYKSGIAAGFWQGVAKVFGNDLKSSYDPEGEDKVTEYLVEKWESGEFEALYYSIFYELPKRTVLPSNTMKLED